jgi:hypothetical protein
LVPSCSFNPAKYVPLPGQEMASFELTGSPWNLPCKSCQKAAGPVGTLTNSLRKICSPRGSPLAAPFIIKKSAFIAATGVPNSFGSALS